MIKKSHLFRESFPEEAACYTALFSAYAENSAKLFAGKSKIRGGCPRICNKKRKGNEKDEELFVYIVSPNCEEKKGVNIKFL